MGPGGKDSDGCQPLIRAAASDPLSRKIFTEQMTDNVVHSEARTVLLEIKVMIPYHRIESVYLTVNKIETEWVGV